MNEQERKELRDKYAEQYHELTGYKLRCIESTGVRPARAKVACRMNIVQVASEYSGIPAEQIVSKNRKAEIVKVRRMVVMVMREFKITADEIIAIVGYNEHSMVSHAIVTHNNYTTTDPEYREEYRKFRKHCRYRIQKIHQQMTENKKPITKATITGVKKMINTGKSFQQVGEVYGIHPATIEKIANNRYRSKRLEAESTLETSK